MKILLDQATELTRGDYPGNPQRGTPENIKVQIPNDAIVTHTPAELFARHGAQIFDAEGVNTPEEALNQYRQLRQYILTHPEMQNDIEPRFLLALKSSAANFDRLLLQRVTYQLDPGEDIDKVAETLQKMPSNAIFRAIEIDRENNRIVTFSSREGIWEVDGEYVAKSAELRASSGQIRLDRSIRSVKDPTRKSDTKRLNYPLFEETKALIESGAIEFSYASREQPDGTWKDDSPTVYVTAMHYKEELSEADAEALKAKEEAAAKIKEETTHVGKRQATKEQTAETLEKNREEIHTRHEIPAPVEEKELPKEIKEEKEDAIGSYVKRLLEEMEARQRREREELEQKIRSALGEERKKAKQTFLASLANGMTVTEALENLKAAKHNDILIQAVLEEVKTDMLNAAQKDAIIAQKSKELETTAKKLETTSRKLEEVERANKTNRESYLAELNKRKEAEIAISKLKTITDRMREEVSNLRSENVDLKGEITEKDKLIAEQEKQLESQFVEIEELKAELKKKDSKIEEITTKWKAQAREQAEKIARLEAKVEEQQRRLVENIDIIEQKEDKIRELEKREQERAVEFAKLEARVEAVESFNQKLEFLQKDFSAQIAQLMEENKRLAAELRAAREQMQNLQKAPELEHKAAEQKEKGDDLLAMTEALKSGPGKQEAEIEEEAE